MGRRQNKNRVNPQAQHLACYSLGQNLGNEDRSTEFKEGFGFIQHDFRNNVAKYISAFVNSKENGKLLVGVSNNGEVVGIGVQSRLEDKIRLDIDEAIKDIQPHIFTDKYTVSFIPVVDNYGQQIDHYNHGPQVVLEIYVAGSEIQTDRKLCSTKQGVFMRRDGSVQELNPAQIQEWVRQKYQAELDRSKNNENNLNQQNKLKDREVKNLEHQYRQKDTQARDQELKIRHLEIENKQLKEQIETLTSQNVQQGAEGGSPLKEDIQYIRQMMEDQRTYNQKKSKVCVIS